MATTKKTEAGYLEFRAGKLVGRLSVRTIEPFDMVFTVRDGKDIVGRVTAYLPRLDLYALTQPDTLDQLLTAVRDHLLILQDNNRKRQQEEVY